MNKIKIIASIVIVFSISYLQTSACSCMMPWEPVTEMERSNTVFIWEVIKIEDAHPLSDMLYSMKEDKVTFKVSGLVKWDISKSVSLLTANSSAACGYNFQEWKEYIVYAWEHEWKLRASLCSRTRDIESAWEDLEAFKNIIKDKTEIKDEKEKNNKYKVESYNLYISIISLLVLIFIAVIVFKEINKKD